MKARFLVMVAALLLAISLAWGGTAWADQGSAPVDPSVLTELDAAGGGTVPVIVYATPGHLADLTAEIGPATIDDSLTLIGAVSADVTSDTLDDMAALPYVDYIAADVPTFGTDYTTSLDVTNASIGLGRITPPTAGGLDGTGVGVAVLDSGSADVPDLDGANGQSRVVAFVDFVNHPPPPVRRRRPRHVRRRPDRRQRRKLAAGRPGRQGHDAVPRRRARRQHRLAQGARQPRAGTRLVADRRHRLGDLPPPPVQHPRDEHLGRGRRDGAGRLRPARSRGRRRLAGRHRGRLRRRQRGRLRPGRHPVARQRPVRHHGGRRRHAADRRHERRHRVRLQLVGPTLYDEYAKPDLVAPGNHLVSLRAPGAGSTSPTRRRAWRSRPTSPAHRAGCPASYAVMSGTSASAPVVAGAAALMVQQDPSLTPGDVKLRLMDSADRWPAPAATPRAPASRVAAALADTATTAGYDLSAKLGNGSTILPPDVLLQWQKYAWSNMHGPSTRGRSMPGRKYAWSKYALVEIRMVQVRMVGRDQRAVTQSRHTRRRPADGRASARGRPLYVALTLLAAAACSLAAYSMHHEVELGGLIASSPSRR